LDEFVKLDLYKFEFKLVSNLTERSPPKNCKFVDFKSLNLIRFSLLYNDPENLSKGFIIFKLSGVVLCRDEKFQIDFLFNLWLSMNLKSFENCFESFSALKVDVKFGKLK
jgi:hypothetical protein